MRTALVAAACVGAILCPPTAQAQQNVSQRQVPDWREEYAYTLGVQAYMYAFPVVYLSELRYNWVTDPRADFYAALNHLHHKRALADAKSYRSGGSPNYDTLYSWGGSTSPRGR